MQYRGYDRNFGLNGKVALITGSAQGIGKAIAELFAEKGGDLVLVDRQAEVKAVADSILGAGGRIISMIGDLTKTQDVENFVVNAVSELGKIDILVNNAGVVHLDDAEKLSERYWDATIAVNLKAPFVMCQRVAQEMIRSRRGGKIVNMSSQAAIVALDKHVAYCASKAGLVAVTKVLATEWAKYDIAVNCISPTVVNTELGKKAWSGEAGDAMMRRIPAGRFCNPEEIAAAALYLCSDAADMITGSNLVIDGGYTVE